MVCCLSGNEESCSEDDDTRCSSGCCDTCCTADIKHCSPAQIRAWCSTYRHVSTAIFVRVIYCFTVVIVIVLKHVLLDNPEPRPGDYFVYVFFFVMVLEMLYTIIRRKGKEWKWVTPSTFALLLGILPTIWEMQLEVIRYESMNSTSTTDEKIIQTEKEAVKAIVLATVFVIMFGKWMTPKGELTAQEHYALLIGILASGADILEVLDLANKGKPEPFAIVVLTAFSWSMLQLFICTSTVKKLPPNDSCDKNQNREECADKQCSISEENGDTAVDEAMTSTVEMPHGRNKSYFSIRCNRFCFYNEIWALVVTTLCQDIPFFALRVFTLIRYREDATFITFFFCIKNGLAMFLALNRIRVIFKKEYRPWKEQSRKLQNHESTGRRYMVSHNIGFDSQDTLPSPTP